MLLYVRGLEEEASTFHVPTRSLVADLVAALGRERGSQVYLTFGCKPLRAHLSLETYGIHHGCWLEAQGRLPGGGSFTLTVKPRLQKDRWSLYWKESMETKTEILDEIALDVNLTTKVSEIQQQVQQRLDGFQEQWEFAVHKGRALKPDLTLQECGITGAASITAVRRALVPEGWKIIQEGEDDLSSSDDDF